MHPHPPHGKASSLKEHFLHFFMLFLAILGGAFAENFREHKIERFREKQYYKSFIFDMKEDSTNLEYIIGSKIKKQTQVDSLISLLNSSDLNKHTKDIYYFARLITQKDNFFAAEGTLNQLQFAGGYRLIESDEVIDKISKYVQTKSKITTLLETEKEILINYRDAASKVFKADVFSRMLNNKTNKNYPYFIKPLDENIPLFSTNPEKINELTFWISSENGNLASSIELMKKLKAQSAELIQIISKEL